MAGHLIAKLAAKVETRQAGSPRSDHVLTAQVGDGVMAEAAAEHEHVRSGSTDDKISAVTDFTLS